MAKPQKTEVSVLWLGAFSSLLFVIGMIFTVLVPANDKNWSSDTADMHIVNGVSIYKVPYTERQRLGRLVYQREGCMYCHSQQIRPLRAEMIRYGLGDSPAPAADEREYVYDIPHFFGTKRNGPDLSRVGGKYSDDWQYSHLFRPQQMNLGSIMPAHTWLFTVANGADPSSPPVPTEDAVNLVAYLQSLGASRQVFDPALNHGKGGYRPWLRTQDALFSQQQSNVAVRAAAHPVHVIGGEKASTGTM